MLLRKGKIIMYKTENQKNPYYIGKIDSMKLLLNRKGKVNLGQNPEIRASVHKSKKDYDRNRDKQSVRSQINSF